MRNTETSKRLHLLWTRATPTILVCMLYTCKNSSFWTCQLDKNYPMYLRYFVGPNNIFSAIIIIPILKTQNTGFPIFHWYRFDIKMMDLIHWNDWTFYKLGSILLSPIKPFLRSLPKWIDSTFHNFGQVFPVWSVGGACHHASRSARTLCSSFGQRVPQTQQTQIVFKSHGFGAGKPIKWLLVTPKDVYF